MYEGQFIYKYTGNFAMDEKTPIGECDFTAPEEINIMWTTYFTASGNPDRGLTYGFKYPGNNYVYTHIDELGNIVVCMYFLDGCGGGKIVKKTYQLIETVEREAGDWYID